MCCVLTVIKDYAVNPALWWLVFAPLRWLACRPIPALRVCRTQRAVATRATVKHNRVKHKTAAARRAKMGL